MITEKQAQLFANGINKIIEQFDDNNLVGAAKSAKVLGAVLQMWATNGKTKVWDRKGQIKKKYKK